MKTSYSNALQDEQQPETGYGIEGRPRIPYRFFAVTFIWSWLVWLPLVLAGFGIIPLSREFMEQVSLPAIIVAAFGPAVGAFYCLRTLDGKGAILRYLRGILDLRLGWEAWIIPVIVVGGVTSAAWRLPEIFGAPHVSNNFPFLLHSPVFLLIIGLFAGSQEELGWRGYILDPLEQRLGPWLGNLVLGVVWALWHLPLFFIPGNSQVYMPFAGFVLLTVGYSWFLSWVRAVSGKRLFSGIYAHGLFNVFGTIFPTILTKPDCVQARYWVWVILIFVVGFTTMAIRSFKRENRFPGNPRER